MKYFIALLLLLLPVFSESFRIESVSLGMDNYVRNEKWIPVVFHISNTEANFRGTLEVVKGETIFRRSLDLGPGTRKRIEILYYQSSQYENIYYQILNQQGLIVLKEKLEPRMVNYADNLILVVSRNEYGHQFLNGQANPWGGKAFVAYKKPDDLFEEWMSYSAVDGVAIGTLSVSELLPSQWQSLTQYAAMGGVLICSPFTDISLLNHPTFRNHFPGISAELNQTATSDFLIRDWPKYSTDPLPVLNLPAQSLHPNPPDRLLAVLPSGSCMVTSSPFWKGNLIYFAFDYTRIPPEIAVPYSKYWNGLIYPTLVSGQPQFAMPFRKRLEENPKVQKYLYDIPGLRLPDVKWFALFFFVYVCAIGPFQYLVLKFLKKSSLLWITFPAIIVLFTFSSLAYARYRQSGEGRITQVAVTEVFPALNSQTTYQAYGVTIRQTGTFHFQSVPTNGFIRKFAFQSVSYIPEPYELSEDLPRELQNESLKNWTFRTFDSISLDSGPPAIRVSASIRGKDLEGEIMNSTDYTLQDSFFLYDSRNSSFLGTIAPGAKRSFSFPLVNASGPPFTELHLRDLLHLYSTSYASPHFFFGEVQDPAGELLMNGKSQKTHCTRFIAVYTEVREEGPQNSWTTGSY